VYNALKLSAIDLGTSGRDDHYGWGRVDVSGSVNLIKNLPQITDVTPPTIFIANPTNNTTVSGTSTVTGNATDNINLSKIELFVNGILSDQTSVSPYSFSIDSTNLKGGSNSIDVKAYDTSSNIASSKVIVNVGDTQPPTVSITSPSDGTKVSRKVLITVSATDDSGISKVEIFIDNALKTSITGTKYQYIWYTRSASLGDHIIMVKATDISGNTAVTSITVRK
jgi:hypothetical protein